MTQVEESIAGYFEIDWSHEDLERVTRTMVKSYNAEIHAQSTIEALLELRHAQPFRAAKVERRRPYLRRRLFEGG